MRITFLKISKFVASLLSLLGTSFEYSLFISTLNASW